MAAKRKKAAAKGRAKKAAPKKAAKKAAPKRTSATKRAGAKKVAPAKKMKKAARPAGKKRPAAGRRERLGGGDVAFSSVTYTDATGAITKVKVVVQPGPKQSAIVPVTNGTATVPVPNAINVTRITVQTDPGLNKDSSKSFNSTTAPSGTFYVSATAATSNATSDVGTTVTGTAQAGST
jgi:hypothetical protein